MTNQVAATADYAADELLEIVQAYHQVTERLQNSHETLQSEVQRLREQLAATNAQLERSRRLSALGQMGAGIAHEIRNPLAAIQLYAGLVIDDLKHPDARPDVALENTRKIAEAVTGLNAIVVDVLSFAREIDPQPRDLQLHQVVGRVIDTHQPAIAAAGVQVNASVNSELSVWADPNLLHQALLNLMRNSVDAMSSVPKPRVLTIAADTDGNTVSITVRDTGPGIDESDIERIFNPFFTTRSTGTGLGLAIVHRIVDVHDGQISVFNDGGAVFKLSLHGQVRSSTCDVAVKSQTDRRGTRFRAIDGQFASESQRDLVSRIEQRPVQENVA